MGVGRTQTGPKTASGRERLSGSFPPSTVRAIALSAALCLGLTGCLNITGNACPDPASVPVDPSAYPAASYPISKDPLPPAGYPPAGSPAVPRSCDGSFFSAQNQRDALYSGNIVPRLFTGFNEPGASPIDTSRINAPSGPSVNRQIAAYEGNLRVEVPIREEAVDTDIENLTRGGARKFNPQDNVNVRFERATIDFVLRQLLNGALGMNYIAPDDLGGSVTFRTEEPVPKSQVLEIVRDILSRNGFVMKFVNGVYHIGRPDLIEAMDANSVAGRAGERITKVIRLRKGNAQEVTAFIRQLLPEEVTVLSTNSPDTIIVRAPPGDIQRVEEVVTNLADKGGGDDRVAIIPLRQAAPEQVASQLEAFLRARTGVSEGALPATIIPLERQQAIMVGSRDQALMAGIRRMIETLDIDRSDVSSLRIVPLRFLNSDEIVPQLNGIFGSGGGGGGGDASSGTAGARGRAAAGGDGNGNGNGSSGSSSRPFPTSVSSGATAPARPLADNDEIEAVAPPLPPGLAAGLGGGRGSGAGSGGGGGGGGGPAAGGGAPGSAGIRIVSDPRSNSVMVYAPFGVFKRIRDVLHSLDKPQAQVVIEATVLEVSINDQLQNGVQWYLEGQGFSVRSAVDPQPTDTGAPGGRAAIGGNIGNVRADVVLNALQQITTVKVISSPYLTVVDGKAARLVIGDQIPFATRTQSSNNLGNVTVTEEIETKDTGVVLDVTPRIFPNNSVALEVNQSVSRPSQSVLQGDRTPVVSTRSVKSSVVVNSGRTILLGGLIQDRLDQTETGVPILRKIPVVGALFKSDEDRVTRAELVVLITPRVIRQSNQMDDVVRLLRYSLNPN